MKHSIKGFVAVLVLAGLMALGWLAYQEFLTKGMQPSSGTKILNQIEKEGAPDFALQNLKGNPVRLSDFKGQIVILNFWASWCDPCVEEFPSMIRLLDQFPKDVTLLAVSADYTKEDMIKFLKAFDADRDNLVVVWDEDRKVGERYGTAVLPESYIIDRDGKLIRKIAGVEDWASPEAIYFFEQLISSGQDKKSSK